MEPVPAIAAKPPATLTLAGWMLTLVGIAGFVGLIATGHEQRAW